VAGLASRIGVVVVGGALGAALIVAGRGHVSNAELRAVVATVDARVREAAERATARVEEASAVSELRAAVSTDAATVRDLTHDELALTAQPGEVVELGQRWRDGHTTSLLLRPERATPVAALDRGDGRYASVVGNDFYITIHKRIVPLERSDELVGIVAVSRAVSFDSLRAELARLGAGARLIGPGGSIDLGELPLAVASAQHPLTLPIAGADGARLVVAGGGKPVVPLVAGGALVILAALGFALAPRRGRVAPAAATTAAVAPRPTGSFPGGELGRYTILRTLGTGGMAEVHLAKLKGEAGFSKNIALKVLRPEHALDPVAIDHFLDEARLASQLTHPNIVQISDLGKMGDDYFIAMEYVEGADLARIQQGYEMHRIKIPLSISLAVLRQICAGLHAAHTATDPDGQPLGLVHRDVKSANVFVSVSGIVKVGDFGIAKAREGARVRQTVLGEVKGTAEYMAPEQRAGESVDARADQYGVGAIAYELLAGELINLDLARLAHLGRVGWPHLTPLTQLRPEIPEALAACVMKALSYEPSDRYASCEQLLDALEEVGRAHDLLVDQRDVAQWLKENASYWEAPAAADVARRTRTRGSPT
jgi:hypothetical protein